MSLMIVYSEKMGFSITRCLFGFVRRVIFLVFFNRLTLPRHDIEAELVPLKISFTLAGDHVNVFMVWYPLE